MLTSLKAKFYPISENEQDFTYTLYPNLTAGLMSSCVGISSHIRPHSVGWKL